MMNDCQCQTCKEIRAKLKARKKQVDELMQGHSFEDPVNIDLIKTTKAMFYEDALAIFRKAKKQNGGK